MLWRGGGALKSDAALRVLRHITGIATKRHDPTGVFGSNVILDDCGLGGEALRVSKLLQWAHDTRGNKRTPASF